MPADGVDAHSARREENDGLIKKPGADFGLVGILRMLT